MSTPLYNLKLVVGISEAVSPGLLDKYIALGAGEFYLGYVPDYWSDNLGYELSPNRRQHHSAQFTGFHALQQTVSYLKERKKPVYLVLNEHAYSQPRLAIISRMLEQVSALGLDGCIVSSLALLVYLNTRHKNLRLHIGTDMGCFNLHSIAYMQELGASRIILPQELSYSTEIAGLIKNSSADMEFEIFLIGDSCHFLTNFCFEHHAYNADGEPNWLCNNIARYVTRVPKREKYLDEIILSRCGLCFLPDLTGLGEKVFFKIPGRERNLFPILMLLDSITRGRVDLTEIRQKCSKRLCYR